MCFYNDNYDWHSSVYEEKTLVADKPIRCDECPATIGVGDNYRQIYQQQSEECRDCDDGCQCDPPNYGETYTYWCCESCWKFREAIKAREQDEGCPPHASQPSLGGIMEELSEFERAEIEGYLGKAESMFPELVASGYLPKIRERLIGGDDE